MAAPDGEEQVPLAAPQIVKPLGMTTTIDNDILQVLSHFEHRFSSMNFISRKLEATSLQESHDLESTSSSKTISASQRPSRKARKSSLDRAEDVINHWDAASSDQAQESMIFECPVEDAEEYLGAVDKVQNKLESLTVHNQDPEILERVQNLLQLSMARLEEEFRHMLEQHSVSVDPYWLLDCLLAGSFANSQENEVTVPESCSGNEDDDFPVAEPVGDLPAILDLVPTEVAIDLQNIAQRMIRAGDRKSVV